MGFFVMDTGSDMREEPCARGDVSDEISDDGRVDRRAGFLGFVAHEVRNPLSTALWTAELLARMSPEDRAGARGEKLSGMCLRSLGRVRQLVEDHFLCERLDVQGIPLHVEALGVREVAESATARPPPGSGPITVDVPPDLAVEADRVLLERALESLVAIAGRDAAPVRIAVRDDGERLAFVVSGQAPEGASMEDPTKGSPSDPKGRSLALPVARRVAAAHGGTLAAADGGWILSLPRSSQRGARPPNPDPSQP